MSPQFKSNRPDGFSRQGPQRIIAGPMDSYDADPGQAGSMPYIKSRRQEMNLHPSVYRTVAPPIGLHRNFQPSTFNFQLCVRVTGGIRTRVDPFRRRAPCAKLIAPLGHGYRIWLGSKDSNLDCSVQSRAAYQLATSQRSGRDWNRANLSGASARR